jgi:hypothetical protein
MAGAEELIFEWGDGEATFTVSTAPYLGPELFSLGMQDGGGFMSCWVPRECLERLRDSINKALAEEKKS